MARPATQNILALVKDEEYFYAVMLDPYSHYNLKYIVADRKGENEVIGVLKDNGFRINRVSVQFPKWAAKQLAHSDLIFIKTLYYSRETNT